MKKFFCLLTVVMLLCSCTSEQTQNADTSPIITNVPSPVVDVVTNEASQTATETALSATASDSSPSELAADLPDTMVYIDKYGSQWLSCDEEIYISNIGSNENTTVFSREYYCADDR